MASEIIPQWTEVISGKPNQLPLDRKPTKVNDSSNNAEHISHKLPHNLLQLSRYACFYCN
jgi:hypothetical protein